MANKALDVAKRQEVKRPMAWTCGAISQQRVTNSKPRTGPPHHSPFTSCSPDCIGWPVQPYWRTSTLDRGNKSGFWNSWENYSGWASRGHTVTWHALRGNVVACLFDRDENGDNRLLFFKIKCSGSSNQLKNWADRWRHGKEERTWATATRAAFRLIRSLEDSALCLVRTPGSRKLIYLNIIPVKYATKQQTVSSMERFTKRTANPMRRPPFFPDLLVLATGEFKATESETLSTKIGTSWRQFNYRTHACAVTMNESSTSFQRTCYLPGRYSACASIMGSWFPGNITVGRLSVIQRGMTRGISAAILSRCRWHQHPLLFRLATFLYPNRPTSFQFAICPKFRLVPPLPQTLRRSLQLL